MHSKHPRSWPFSDSWNLSGSPLPVPSTVSFRPVPGCFLRQHPVRGISPARGIAWPARAGDKLPVALQTEDREYDDLEEKFQCVVSSVAVLKENVASYLGHLEVKP